MHRQARVFYLFFLTEYTNLSNLFSLGTVISSYIRASAKSLGFRYSS